MEINSLQLLQNKAANIVGRFPPRSHRSSIFDKPGWLTINQLIVGVFLPKVHTHIWWLQSHNESFSSVLNVLILDPLVSIVTANAQQGRRISVCLEKKMQKQGKSRLAVMVRGVFGEKQAVFPR